MQRPTIINLKKTTEFPLKENYVYVGRPSKWGNPFVLGYRHGFKREEIIQKYREWIQKKPELLACLPELAGKTLGCFCVPLGCHAEVLADLVEALPDGE